VSYLDRTGDTEEGLEDIDDQEFDLKDIVVTNMVCYVVKKV